MIFSDSESVLKGICKTSTMNKTSGITQMLKDKIERLESRKKKSNFAGSRGTVELTLMRELTRSKAINERCRDGQLLLPVADKEELPNFCQNTERDRGESYFERYYRSGSSSWVRQIKMNRRVFVSINRMRAGHSSLKASLSRFNIVSTA
jgi:hypothetical protein